jgi:hypothetical protein
MVVEEPRDSLVRRTLRWLSHHILARIWYVGSPVVFMFQAAPAECLERLKLASKPSARRLHQLNLFQQGRRYFVQPKRDGFRLTTTRRLLWRYRKRTTAVAVANATVSAISDDITRIDMQTRMGFIYVLSSLAIPVFMTTILVYVPWPPVVIAVSLITLYGLSWAGHRLNAIIEAHEMVWFVQKALEDLDPAEIARMDAYSSAGTIFEQPHRHVYDDRDFAAEWERFMEEQGGE